MPVFYAVIDQRGLVVRSGSCPIDSVNDQAAPGEQAIQTERQVSDLMDCFVNGKWRALPPKPNIWMKFDPISFSWVDERTDDEKSAALEVYRLVAISRINAAVSSVRLSFCTDLPGQQMIYMAKETEALRWITDDTPDLRRFPMMSAEVGLTASNPDNLSQVWLNMANLWRVEAGRIENARFTATAAVENASSIEEIDRAESDFTLSIGADTRSPTSVKK
jgi:hypothetical protein